MGCNIIVSNYDLIAFEFKYEYLLLFVFYWINYFWNPNQKNTIKNEKYKLYFFNLNYNSNLK